MVPYAQLVGAADARNLNAAVVDTSSYWVAAIDGRGRVIASEIPRPQAGRDFAQADGAPKAAAPALPGAFELATHLRDDGVAVLGPAPVEADSGGSGGLMRYLAIPLGVGILAAVLIGGMMLIRGRNPNGRGANGRGGAAGHGKIRKNAQVEPPSVRFADVAGCDEVVEELTEVVTFLREPERFRAVGARMPRGVILHGPPGTGKTLIAKAVAGEAGVPFFALSGSDFVDTFVGVGASRVRDLFAEARKDEKGKPNRGAIIFFDEIDAIGRARGQGNSGADSEREGTLNQLLVELDGFGDRDKVVVIAATNRLDMLDAALLRPGRFDRRVQVGLPAEAGRLEILRLHSRSMPIAEPDVADGAGPRDRGLRRRGPVEHGERGGDHGGPRRPRDDPPGGPGRGHAARRRRPPEGGPPHRRGRAGGDRLARGRARPGGGALPHPPEGPEGHDPRPRRRRRPRPLRQPGPHPHLAAAPPREDGGGDGRARRRADPLRRDLVRRRQRPGAGEPDGPRGRRAARLLAARRPDRVRRRRPPDPAVGRDAARDRRGDRPHDRRGLRRRRRPADRPPRRARRPRRRPAGARAGRPRRHRRDPRGAPRRRPPPAGPRRRPADVARAAAGRRRRRTRSPAPEPVSASPTPRRSPVRAGRVCRPSACRAGAVCGPASRRPRRRCTRSPSPVSACAGVAGRGPAWRDPSRPVARMRGGPWR